MAATSPIAISITVNPKDLARLDKTLNKWQGKELAVRIDKAMQAGMKLYISPLRAQAARHNRTGATQRGYAVRKLRKRTGEIAAYKVGSNTWYKHFAISGTSRGVEADPYVDAVHNTLETVVGDFISTEVTRLA